MVPAGRSKRASTCHVLFGSWWSESRPPQCSPPRRPPTSTTFIVTGFEYAFTPDGFFAGFAIGNVGERGAWNTYVEHDWLGSEPPIYVTGGSFGMATRSSTGTYDWGKGTFGDAYLLPRASTREMHHLQRFRRRRRRLLRVR